MNLVSAISQVPETVWGGLVVYGPLGIFSLWMMWREGKREERDHKREERLIMEHEEIKVEIRKNSQSTDHLIQAVAIEALSRLGSSSFAGRQAQELIDAAKARTASAK